MDFEPTRRYSVCTYQAISGAGKTFETWPEMVDNVIPYIGGEEEKSREGADEAVGPHRGRPDRQSAITPVHHRTVPARCMLPTAIRLRRSSPLKRQVSTKEEMIAPLDRVPQGRAQELEPAERTEAVPAPTLTEDRPSADQARPRTWRMVWAFPSVRLREDTHV